MNHRIFRGFEEDISVNFLHNYYQLSALGTLYAYMTLTAWYDHQNMCVWVYPFISVWNFASNESNVKKHGIVHLRGCNHITWIYCVCYCTGIGIKPNSVLFLVNTDWQIIYNSGYVFEVNSDRFYFTVCDWNCWQLFGQKMQGYIENFHTNVCKQMYALPFSVTNLL